MAVVIRSVLPHQRSGVFVYENDRITPEALALIVTSQETIETDVLPVYIEERAPIAFAG